MPLTSTDTSSVNTQSSVDKYGNNYTTAVDSGKLTNDDFLKLMLTELKYQDPTKPMDSKNMMDSQLKMSQIEANATMSESMQSLEKTFTQTSMSNAISFMGKKLDAIVNVPVTNSQGEIQLDENGDVIYEKVKAPFKVETVENVDGDVTLNAKEFLGLRDMGLNTATNLPFSYDQLTGRISDTSGGKLDNGDGTYTNLYVKLTSDGRFDLDTNGNVQIVDHNGNAQTPMHDPDSSVSGDEVALFRHSEVLEEYSTQTTSLKYEDVVKIYPFT